MNKYPTPGTYQEAVQFPEDVFSDPLLQRARPDEDALGLPLAVTGAFAVVFSLRSEGQRWAVKCFLHEVADQQRRYQAVARHLAAHPVSGCIGFDYQPAGLRLAGRTLPLVKMEWVDGVPLNRYVAEHLAHPAQLEALAEAWRGLLAELEAAQVAHGDLQHGNVLVVEAADGVALRLVDYDTMYVPALKGRRSPEVGHRNYQHPDRDPHDYGPYLDRFAGLVVYTALRACARAPELWAQYDTGEAMLFSAADFYDPDRSPLFGTLGRLSDLAGPVAALQKACYLPPEAVPPLEAVLAEEGAGRMPAREQERVRRARRRVRRGRFARHYRTGLLLWLAVGILGVMGGQPGLAAAWVGLGLPGIGWATWRHYIRLPAVRRRRRLRREQAYFEGVLAGLTEEAARLRQALDGLTGQAEALAGQWLRERQEDVLEAHLKHHFVAEAAAVEGVTHKHVVRLKAAGIRNAYHATPARLARVPGIGEATRARVARWRAELEARYRTDVPVRLSPAEERRLARHVQRRAADLQAALARNQAKAQAQQAEMDQMVARVQALPQVSFGHYLKYVLHLGALPPQHPPSVPARPRRAVERAVGSDASGEERPWWEALRD